jgi:mannose-6-phosphate isomerase-like protein (cupin superfamily)
MRELRKIDLAEKFGQIHEHWSPRIAAELNGQHVKLVKFVGEFVWHKHDYEDELFLVVQGSFRMEYRVECHGADGATGRDGRGGVRGSGGATHGVDRTVMSLEIGEGQFVVVPRGMEHRPVAEREVSVLLFEPVSTLNTGDAVDARRVDAPQSI